MLQIKNLHASIGDRDILKGINLDVKPGEVHAIMGPNGSGKSTLANVIAGREDYTITKGSIHMEGKDIMEMSPELRALQGLFLSFQYPIEIPGVTVSNFVKTALNELRKGRG
ncbi:MAG: ATP-binding cassette domain-containing protein, partial [Bacteroidetes bacterium]|nr:ATP-binding cassette domain-containing protein [Bacteroidota bacterium]